MCILIGGVTEEEGELTRDTNSPCWELSGFVYAVIRGALHCPLYTHAGIRVCVYWGLWGVREASKVRHTF